MNVSNVIESVTERGGFFTLQGGDLVTGVGAGVAPQMKSEGCRANAVKVASSPTEKTDIGEFRNFRSQLWWCCREWLRIDSGAMLPPDDDVLCAFQRIRPLVPI